MKKSVQVDSMQFIWKKLKNNHFGYLKLVEQRRGDSMIIEEELSKRNLPDLFTMNNGDIVTLANWELRRKELLECLSENLYGFSPDAPDCVNAEKIGHDRFRTFGGKANSEIYKISFNTPNGEYSFPISIVIPINVEKPAVIFNINFPSYPVPEEEIIDNGFALVSLCYNDAFPDDPFSDFTEGLGGKYIGNRKREKTEWGKIGIWAYAASRVMDYLVTRDDVNVERVAISGHSRLGKTALWCRAQDPRFFIAYGNNANYGGGGLIRGHIGEDVPNFIKAGSFDFFCEGWKDFLNTPHSELPFDQHFLMALQAPGLVYLAGATNDGGMDPLSEFLSCCAVNDVYKMFGKRGLVFDGEMPPAGKELIDGEIGFHIREGGHYFSREDWNHFMEFFKKHL